MKKSLKILALVAFIIGLCAYNLWPLLGSKVFYTLIAVEFCVLYFIIWQTVTGKYWRLTMQAIFITCLSSLIDEIFFDPSKIGINEYVGFVVIVLTTFLVYGKSGKREFKR